MIEKINNDMRKIFVLLGCIFALFKLLEKIEFKPLPEKEGFQQEEFDDIW